MPQSLHLEAHAVARLAITAGFELLPINSRWQSSAWRLAWVCPADALAGADGQSASPDAMDRTANDTFIEIHRDESEGYWLNVTAAEPSIFVLWRADDGEPPQALAATLSYHEAGRWMDGGQNVDRVPMPPEMTAWLTDWVNRTYEPQQRKRQRGQRPSFMARSEFARLAQQCGSVAEPVPSPEKDK